MGVTPTGHPLNEQQQQQYGSRKEETRLLHSGLNRTRRLHHEKVRHSSISNLEIQNHFIYSVLFAYFFGKDKYGISKLQYAITTHIM